MKPTGKLTSERLALPAYETALERTERPSARFSLLDDMFIERGTIEDWGLLQDLHYKAEHLPFGPKFWKLTLYGNTIGVIVTGAPKGLLKERHLVMPQLKPGGNETKLTNTQRYQYINANFRVISRFVVDTMYRGVGCGYRMMNIVSRMEGKTFMEIQSSMSKFNFFGQKAGFKFVRPINANKYEAGMKFFRTHFASSPQDFEAILAEMEAKDPIDAARTLEECREFYYRHSALEKTGSRGAAGRGLVDSMDARKIIKNLQQVSLASPMYGIWKNPDPKIILPDRLPILAFDWQKPTEKFAMERLDA